MSHTPAHRRTTTTITTSGGSGARKIAHNFDPDQPRDDDGKFASTGGGGGGGGGEKDNTPDRPDGGTLKAVGSAAEDRGFLVPRRSRHQSVPKGQKDWFRGTEHLRVQGNKWRHTGHRDGEPVTLGEGTGLRALADYLRSVPRGSGRGAGWDHQ